MLLPTWKPQVFFQRRVSPTGLALFRICFCAVMFWDVADFCRYRHFIFDPVPYLQSGESYLQFLLPCWLVIVGLLMLGCFTRITSILNYICSAFIYGGLTDFEYHYDNICLCINFLLLFIPLSETWSVDAWLKRRRGLPPSEGVHPIYYFVLMFGGIGLVYIDSIFWKQSQSSWQNGYGVWRPMSLPPFTWFPTNEVKFVLNQHWLMQLSNHLTFFLEASFIFLVWSRRCRLYVLLPLGVMLHIGIMVAFPIPKFSLAVLSMYVLLVPPDFWDRLQTRLTARLKKLRPNTGHESNNELATSATRSSLFNHRYAIVGMVCLFISLCGGQALIALQDHAVLNPTWLTPERRVLAQRFTGLCTHSVFMDFHWTCYDHVIALVHVRPDGTYDWLPLSTPEGQMGSMAIDRFWVFWAFRANGPYINNDTAEKAVKRVSAYWLAAQGQSLDKAKFLVLTKALQPHNGWRENELVEQMQMPWQVSGEVNWQANECTVLLTPLKETKPLSVGANPFIPTLTSPFSNGENEKVQLGAQQIHFYR